MALVLSGERRAAAAPSFNPACWVVAVFAKLRAERVHGPPDIAVVHRQVLTDGLDDRGGLL